MMCERKLLRSVLTIRKCGNYYKLRRIKGYRSSFHFENFFITQISRFLKKPEGFYHSMVIHLTSYNTRNRLSGHENVLNAK